jgi:ATP-dependent protease HslVU (ClpYQ) peptidase subunit
MTCIVGLVDKGKVYIGGDSAGVGGSGQYSLKVRNDRKVFRNGDFVMGFTSSFRMGQLLAFAMSPPKPREGDDLMAFMVRDFIGCARQTLKDGGFAKAVNSEESAGTFLVGFRGRLFHITDDYQVGESSQPYDACGCGDQLALGSLFSTPNIIDPRERVLEALAAAEAFSAGVRGPFHMESAP